eukprot:TRINITY_DN3779_c0_g1_i1.p1 TRINITY_DN3779_c0_g1~~TRINITY_DN3779_c0_g1_i1.p1  ORF type:complete len:308 (-),score=32.14 TRINITY_DN3779_c0_g1_i1:87-935(-)
MDRGLLSVTVSVSAIVLARWLLQRLRSTSSRSSVSSLDHTPENNCSVAPPPEDELADFFHPGGHVPLQFPRLSNDEMRSRLTTFCDTLATRRSCRDFSPDPIPADVLDQCVAAAASAPSGANMQPWTFVVVTRPDIKQRIRSAVEREEFANYAGRMKKSWRDDLRPIGTTDAKPYLETAPALILVFKHTARVDPQGRRVGDVYYPEQSVHIAVGILLCALNAAGLVSLTSTPMGAEADLREVCGRPAHERLVLLMPVGRPAVTAKVPRVRRKPLGEVRVALK